ncbi:hypothetical protein [Spirosoma pomorum]
MATADTFRNERANELLRIKDLLGRSMPEIRTSVDTLSTAASHCKRSKEDTWQYEVTNLMFPKILVKNSGVRHSRPSIESYEVTLSINAFGICTEEDSLVDPISDLNVDIVVTGYTKRHKRKINALHLDSHPPREIAVRRKSPIPDLVDAYKTSGLRVNAVHPRYHFQMGGQKVWSSPSYEFGSQLILETPRIAHPPLDAVLAIDFVLANYYSNTWASLHKSDGQYSDLIETAQEVFWRPYLFAAASTWSPFSVANPRWLPQQTFFSKAK